MANPSSRGQQRDKPFRDAIRMEAALLEKGEESPALPGSIRHSARALLIRAGADNAAFREAADRMDGKPAQSLEMSGGLAISHEEALDQLDGAGTGDTPQTS